MRSLLVVLCLATYSVFAQSEEDQLNDRGVALLNDENYTEAIPIFNHLVAQNPDMTTYRYNRAVALFNLKRFNEALKDYSVLHSSLPEETEYTFQMGNCYENMDSVRQAIHYYSEAIKGEQSFYIYYFKRGTLYLKQGVWKKSEQDFTAALSIDPKHHNSLHNRGIARYQLGQRTAACNDWCEAYQLGNPTSKSHLDKNCNSTTQPCKSK